MRKCLKAVLALLLAAVSLSAIAMAYPSDNVEYRPAEKAMERLFDKGIGDPWVGGEPFASDIYSSDKPIKEYRQTEPVQNPFTDCQLMGFFSVNSGLIIASDEGSSLKLHPSPGSYPVYGCFENGKLIGLFIDLSYSAS